MNGLLVLLLGLPLIHANSEALYRPERDNTHSIISETLRDSIVNELSFKNKNHYLCDHGKSFPQKVGSCYCDDDCHRFGDCCVDVVSSTTTDYVCEKISALTSDNNYVKRSCSPSYDVQRVRDNCLKNTTDLQSATYANDVPVFYNITKTLYKNLYCLLCSVMNTRMSDVYNWDYDLAVNSTGKEAGFALGDILNKYDPKTRLFNLRWKGKVFHAALYISEFFWSNFSSVFHTRPCQSVVNHCPSETPKQVFEKCESYTFYHHQTGNSSRVFKNYHCALCNGLSNVDITVGLPRTTQDKDSDDDPDVIVSDVFNVGDVGGCSREDFLNGSLKCLRVNCTDGHIWNGKVCVPQANTDKCSWVFLQPEWVTFLENGSIYLNNTGAVVESGKFEKFLDGENGPSDVRVCVDHPLTISLNPVQEKLSEICLIINIICLSLQLIIYTAFSKLRSRPGKILMCLSTCLLCGDVSFLISRDVPYDTKNCYIIAILMHFFYLAAFFWMNTMGIDVCKIIVYDIFDLKRGRLFLIYSLYSWLAPTAIVTSAVIVDFAAPDSPVSPAYGRKYTCWLGNKHGVLLFFSMPAVIIVLVNTVLFTLTAISLRKVSVGGAAKNSKNSNFYRTKFQMYVKLAVVLGLPWMFGFVAAWTNFHFLWYPYIVLSDLQGAFIFFGFTFNKKTFKEVKSYFVKDRRSVVTSTSWSFSRSLVHPFRRSKKGADDLDVKSPCDSPRKEGRPLLEVGNSTHTNTDQVIDVNTV